MRATPLRLGILAGTLVLCLAGIARAEVIVVKDSSQFPYRYDFDDGNRPDQSDFNATAPTDFHWVNNASPSGTAVVSGGILTMETTAIAGGNWFHSSNSGEIWDIAVPSLASGYTIEARARIVTDLGYPLAITASPGNATAESYLLINQSSQRWSGVNVGPTVNNSDGFHTFRIAQEPGGAAFSVWRDGVLLSGTLASVGSPAYYRLVFGDVGGGYAGKVEIDYFRFTTGAFAPPAVPKVYGLTFDEVANTPGATRFNFDQYVSNPQPGGSTVNGGVVAAFPSPFTGLLQPDADNTTVTPLPDGVGVLVSDSTGTVTFEDQRSGYTLSEIVGGRTGGVGRSVTFTFVDPEGTGGLAAVSRVALAFASTVADSVTVRFFDPYGNEILPVSSDVAIVPAAGPSPSFASTDGYLCMVNGVETPLIHKLVFTSPGNDLWLFGGFGLQEFDMAYAGLVIIPEPSAVVLLVLGAALLLWRRRR